jgi:NOL1/NOP2/fmu family ribosome biogenesis protein
LTNSENKPWNYLEERFGVKRKDLPNHEIVKRSGAYWLISKQAKEFLEDLEVETAGFRLLRETKYGLKPTTYTLQYLENKITKNIVELSDEELRKMLKREGMLDRNMEKGYVALKYNGDIIGCGFYMDGVVSSRIPKGRSKELFGLL